MSTPEQVVHDEFFESLLGDFLDESGQLLDRLNENLLQLDEWVRSLGDDHNQRCSDELLNEMFRSAHSLKGLSAMLGLKEINQLTHRVENVFDAARKDDLRITGDVVELIFQALDRLVSQVQSLKDPGAEAVESESVIEEIGQMLRQAGVERHQTTQADAERALHAADDSPAPAQPAVTQPAPDRPAPSQPEATQSAEQQPAVSKAASVQAAPSAPAALTAGPRPGDPFSEIRDEAEIPAKYLSIFIDETELSLDSLTETLLNLEGGGNRETIEPLLVTAHRIKGSAASIGLNRAAKLAHLMEDLLQTLLEKQLTLSPEMTDALLRGTDALRQFVQSLRCGEKQDEWFAGAASELLAVQPRESTAPAQAVRTTPTESPVSRQMPAEAPAQPAIPGHVRAMAESLAAEEEEETVLAGSVQFQPNLSLAGLKARLIYEKLCNLGDVSCFEPPAEKLDEMENLSAVAFVLRTAKPLDLVRQQVKVGGVASVALEALNSPQRPSEAAPAPKSPPASISPTPAETQQAAADEAGRDRGKRNVEGSSRPAETLRVDIERLDQLMNLAGQLVISKARFAQIGENLKHSLVHKQSLATLSNVFSVLEKMGTSEDHRSQADLQADMENLRSMARRMHSDLEVVRRDMQSVVQARGSVNNLLEAIHQLDRVADGIQRNIMDTRMVPIGPLFARFRRVIRDITRGNGKQIELVINGEKTELDKRMIDELGDPLIHMVRNSADHGIELPAVRTAAGKPPVGTVKLDAFHRGNSIVIQVSDDGKGLDVDRIRRKAIDKGLVSEADAEKMTRQQIFQLIWEPGLSTAEKVTEVSGRGMGMDIVKSKIEDLHGTVELDSMPGQGTTITIKLPLTLAILPSLMVEISGDVFAMPLEAVVEIVRVGKKELQTVHGKWTAQVRGRVVSMLRLSELFQWHAASAAAETPDEGATLVIIGQEGRELGLAVDRVLGEEDVVIKSMAENYRNVQGIAGASILGDGRVSLILDIGALIEMAAKAVAASACLESVS